MNFSYDGPNEELGADVVRQVATNPQTGNITETKTIVKEGKKETITNVFAPDGTLITPAKKKNKKKKEKKGLGVAGAVGLVGAAIAGYLIFAGG